MWIRIFPRSAVGTRQEFPVAGSPRLVQATCRYAGERVFVFVEDRQWDTNGGSILQSHVDGVGRPVSSAPPRPIPGAGIHDLCIEAFGAVPDVDGYPQVFLLILDIPDSRLVGFFDPRVAGHEEPGYAGTSSTSTSGSCAASPTWRAAPWLTSSSTSSTGATTRTRRSG